jgi:TBC1 domain family member 14
MTTYMPMMRKKGDLSWAKEFKRDLKEGIPLEARKEVWNLMIENNMNITPKLYDALLVRVRMAHNNIENDPTFKKDLGTIERDLHRTMPELNMFREGEILHQSLKNILAAFTLYRPDLGYVQGMSFLAGSLLLNSHDEYLGFKYFANLVNKPLLFEFYSFNMARINIFYNVFMRLLSEKYPKLANAFTEHKVEPSIFLFEWVVAMFANILPIETSSRIWDNYFFFG